MCHSLPINYPHPIGEQSLKNSHEPPIALLTQPDTNSTLELLSSATFVIPGVLRPCVTMCFYTHLFLHDESCREAAEVTTFASSKRDESSKLFIDVLQQVRKESSNETWSEVLKSNFLFRFIVIPCPFWAHTPA